MLVTVGLILLVASTVLVGRDLAFARTEAESEVVALAETGALAIQFAPASEIESYLAGLLRHPAIATATVYYPNEEGMRRGRPPSAESPFLRRFLPGFEAPIVGCRQFADDESTLCLEGDAAFFRNRLAALVIPHSIVLGASALLLLAATFLARGSNRREIGQLARIVRGASEESKYSLRAGDAKGEMGELGRAINALLEQMQQRDLILRRRTIELESANQELEAFSYSVSHDLRSPLASVDGFSQALIDFSGDRLDEEARQYVMWIRDAADQMSNLIQGLLQMSRISRAEISRGRVDLSRIAASLADGLRQRDPARSIDFQIEDGMIVEGDERLLHAVLENLMSNAYKFTGKVGEAVIAVGSSLEKGRRTFFVKDNGAGFDSTQAAKMFTAFQRLHTSSEFEGTGIGLATVKRIIEKHGGAIWADGQPGQGAIFHFTIAEPSGLETRERNEAGQLTRV